MPQAPLAAESRVSIFVKVYWVLITWYQVYMGHKHNHACCFVVCEQCIHAKFIGQMIIQANACVQTMNKCLQLRPEKSGIFVSSSYITPLSSCNVARAVCHDGRSKLVSPSATAPDV